MCKWLVVSTAMVVVAATQTAVASDEEGADALIAEAEAAQLAYDRAAAEALVSDLEVYAKVQPTEELHRTLAETALIVATLYRRDYERDGIEVQEKRRIGQLIDQFAAKGHAALEHLQPEESERFRIEADLWAIMMRTQARSSRLRHEMDDAATRALDLDPDNANAYVTASKRFLFASEAQGGDPREALDMLKRAVRLDPDNELARVFRGIAYHKLGKENDARRDFADALLINPDSMPAREWLDRVGGAAGLGDPDDDPPLPGNRDLE